MKQKTEKKQSKLFNFISQKLVLTFVGTSLFIVGTSRLACAQAEFGARIYGGASTQSQLFNLYDNDDLKSNYGFGVSGEYNFSEGAALQSGLDYLKKGGKSTLDESRQNSSFQYLEVPLQFKLSAGEKVGFNKGQRVFVAAGPYLAYLLDAENKTTELTSDMTDDVNKLDFGFRCTAGISFPLSNENAIQVSMNYDMGISEVYKNSTDIQNKAGFISVGYIF